MKYIKILIVAAVATLALAACATNTPTVTPASSCAAS